MSFLDVRFPTTISYGAAGGPEWRTDVVILDSGHEQRNQVWSAARCRWDVAQACKTDAMRSELIAFFRVVRGRAYSFRFKDFTDFEVASGEGVVGAIGDGTYQLRKRYQNAGGTSDRDVTLPLSVALYAGAVLLTEGVHYNLNDTTGIVTPIGSPTTVPTAWVGEFDVPARFDTDRIGLVAEDIEFFRSQNIPVIEVRSEA